MKLVKRIHATVTFAKQGGRATPIRPTAGTYRPHLVPDGSSSMLGVAFVGGPDVLPLGEAANVEVECLYDISYDELSPGVRFTIVEGRHCVGSGTILGATGEHA